MVRLEGKCPGDCSKCRLLDEGKIESVEVCMIDQVFQRTRNNERTLNRILVLMERKPTGNTFVREPETDGTGKEEAGT